MRLPVKVLKRGIAWPAFSPSEDAREREKSVNERMKENFTCQLHCANSVPTELKTLQRMLGYEL